VKVLLQLRSKAAAGRMLPAFQRRRGRLALLLQVLQVRRAVQQPLQAVAGERLVAAPNCCERLAATIVLLLLLPPPRVEFKPGIC
jgi:hypothetical protein